MTAATGQALARESYRGKIREKVAILGFLAFVLGLAFVHAARAGTVDIGFGDIASVVFGLGQADPMTAYILGNVRLPRVAMAALTGMALACAGAIMQAVLRNPLASPFTLGVSSGASFGAALAIVLGTSLFGIEQVVRSSRWLIVVNAFAFGCLTVMLVYGISRLRHGSTTILLLAGVALGNLFSAGVSALSYFSSNELLRNLVLWLMGGFWGTSWEVIGILAPMVAIVFLILMWCAWDLNVLGLGAEVARTAGVRVERLRLTTLIAVTLIASATIAFTGVIGFIGLVAPHIARMLIGVDHRFLIPASALTGASLLLVSDTVGRTLISPIEIPVGVITAFVGAPFFLYLLLKRRRDFWS